jgi:hypothetical protein
MNEGGRGETMVDTRTCGADTSYSESFYGVALPAWLQQIVQGEGRLTLTDHEAGRLLGVSRGSVRAAIAAHEIEVVYLGRRLLILLIPLLQTLGVEVLPEDEPSGSAAGDATTRSRHGLS